MPTIKDHLINIRASVDAALAKAERNNENITLLLASKGQSVEKIEAAIKAGVDTFGENYLQEALKKMQALSDKKIIWHFIGTIQRNKTRKIAEHFDWVQTVSDVLIAERLDQQRPRDMPPLNICIEVNVNQEKSKSGCRIEEVPALAREISIRPFLKLRGLMCIPEMTENFTLQCQSFKTLRKIFESQKKLYPSMDTLSMGMSHDFEAAILEGATMIRIGRAVFGDRN